jgi:hypothetical protein
MLRTFFLRSTGTFGIVHDDAVQCIGDSPDELPEPIRSVVLQRLDDLRKAGHFEVHYEQREDGCFTHLKHFDAPRVEVEHDITFDGFFVIHEHISCIIPPPLVPFEELPYTETGDEALSGDSGQ